MKFGKNNSNSVQFCIAVNPKDVALFGCVYTDIGLCDNDTGELLVEYISDVKEFRRQVREVLMPRIPYWRVYTTKYDELGQYWQTQLGYSVNFTIDEILSLFDETSRSLKAYPRKHENRNWRFNK